MNLRAITVGVPIDKPLNLQETHLKLQNFCDLSRIEFAKKEIGVRTFRLNLTPVDKNIVHDLNQYHLFLGNLEGLLTICESLNIRWINVPFDLVNSNNSESEKMCELAFQIIKRYPKTFINLIVANNNQINYLAINWASKFIKDVSQLENTGFNNFRVGVSCNPKENTPFFPFTYSSKEMGFSVALELPQELTKIIISSPKSNLLELREKIISQIDSQIEEINQIALSLGQELNYWGIDTSLAPYPEKGGSVGELMNYLGAENFGSNGTLFLTSYLTDILKKLGKNGLIKKLGFNGVMFSLLEDDFLGKSNNQKIFSIDSLISYSSVCGCGLDMVPLPGTIFKEEIASIILDISALSTILNKPLGVRVLPIPLKTENEFTEFNMDFLFNTRIKNIKDLSLNQKLFNQGLFYYQNLLKNI